MFLGGLWRSENITIFIPNSSYTFGIDVLIEKHRKQKCLFPGKDGAWLLWAGTGGYSPYGCKSDDLDWAHAVRNHSIRLKADGKAKGENYVPSYLRASWWLRG